MTGIPGSNTGKLIDLMIRANQFREERQYQQALEIYSEAVERFGETADLDQVIAHCYFNLARADNPEANYKMAFSWIKKAINISPDDSHLYRLLGEYQWLSSIEYEEAANSYRKAIELNPNYGQLLFNAAGLYVEYDYGVTLAEAISWLEKAVQIDPNDANYHMNLGMRYHENGEIAKAESEFIKALVCGRPLNGPFTKTIIKYMGEEDS